MIHIRIVVPADLAPMTLARLEAIDVVIGLVHLRGAARRPVGDVICCDVPREACSNVISVLRELEVHARGSLAIESIEAAVSEDAARAERDAPGLGSDAVVWEALESRTAASAELSIAFVLFMVIATMIASLGIITDSVVLIIGAMVVGPEFGPLAGVCVGLTQRRPDLARRSLIALAIGFPVGILAALAMTGVLIAADVAPGELTATGHPETAFISRPDVYSAIIAVLAGVAGMLSLTTANASVLIGVLISVTTIPAAGNLAVAIAYGNGEANGAAAQLAMNLGFILLAGIATLLVQRLHLARRLRAALRRGGPRKATT